MPRSWSRKIKRLLVNWSKQITINENEHLFRGSRYKFINRGLSFFDLITKAGIFTTLLSAIANNNITVPLIVFITIVDALILTTEFISMYFDFGALSERHFNAAKEYNALSKLIDSTLALDVSDRDNPREFMTLVMKKFSKISDNSPNLPYNAMVHKLDLQIYDDPKNARGDKQSSSDDNDVEIVEVSPLPESARNSVKFESVITNSGEIKRPSYLNYQWNRLENE